MSPRVAGSAVGSDHKLQYSIESVLHAGVRATRMVAEPAA